MATKASVFFLKIATIATSNNYNQYFEIFIIVRERQNFLNPVTYRTVNVAYLQIYALHTYRLHASKVAN